MRRASTLVAPYVETIRDIKVDTLATVNMPKLKIINGTLIIKVAGYVNMPELEIINGRLIIDDAAFFYASKLKEVRNICNKTLERIIKARQKSN